MIRVKVCGMTDPDNLLAISEAGPDYLGYIFYPQSARYIGRAPEMSLFNLVPAAIEKVGVFVNEDIEAVTEIADRYRLDVVQLHGYEKPDYCAVIKAKGIKVIKSFAITVNFSFGDLVSYTDACDFFLFDTQASGFGGSGLKFNWDKLSEYTLDKPFFLSGGIGPGDIGLIEGINNKFLYAVDINSKFETGPGIKDFNAVKTFIKKIKKTGV